MFPRVLLPFLLSSVVLCLAADNLETTTKASKVTTTLSESAILATASVCTFGCVAIVIVPTMIYHKFIGKDTYDEVF